jgi:hypothetical protein
LLYHSGRPGDPRQGRNGLVVAVLEHAVGIFERYAFAPDLDGRRIFADIDSWFASNDIDDPFAFVSVCAVLGLDVAYVRSGLRQWRASHQEALRVKPNLSGLPPRQPASHAASHVRAVRYLPPAALRVVPPAGARPLSRTRGGRTRGR